MPDPTQPVPGPTREQIRAVIAGEPSDARDPGDQWMKWSHDGLSAKWVINVDGLTDAVWALLPARPSPTDDDVCSHGRPDHQELIRQLLEALGMSTAARPYSPARLFGECLAEIERLRAPSLHGHVTDAEDFGSEHGDYTALTIHIPGTGHHQLVDHHVAVVDEGDAMDHPDWGHDPDDLRAEIAEFWAAFTVGENVLRDLVTAAAGMSDGANPTAAGRFADAFARELEARGLEIRARPTGGPA